MSGLPSPSTSPIVIPYGLFGGESTLAANEPGDMEPELLMFLKTE